MIEMLVAAIAGVCVSLGTQVAKRYFAWAKTHPKWLVIAGAALAMFLGHRLLNYTWWLTLSHSLFAAVAVYELAKRKGW